MLAVGARPGRLASASCASAVPGSIRCEGRAGVEQLLRRAVGGIALVFASTRQPTSARAVRHPRCAKQLLLCVALETGS